MEAGERTTIVVTTQPGTDDVVVAVQGELSAAEAVEVIGAIFDTGAAGTDIASISSFQALLMQRLSQAPDLPTVAGAEGYDPHKDRSAAADSEAS